jgi:hypothetical protein
MNGKSWRVYAVAALFALVVLCSARAGDDKPKDEGKAEEFKGKKFELKDKGKARIILSFPADKPALVTVKSEKKTDVNLFIYTVKGKKPIEKDDSPGPDCEIKFTPKKAGKYVLEVVNLGKGANTSTLKVEFK